LNIKVNYLLNKYLSTLKLKFVVHHERETGSSDAPHPTPPHPNANARALSGPSLWPRDPCAEGSKTAVNIPVKRRHVTNYSSILHMLIFFN
jgi:hypothetical protein